MTKPFSSASDDFVTDVIHIQGTAVETRLGTLDQTSLKFFLENPRVYSIVRDKGKSPEQDDIQAELQEMEHVRALVHDIKKHGGLIDALVVKDESLEVVEGNSRLAAYRVLARQAPVKWARIKVRLLPPNLADNLIASLLGQWHLKGKKEWPPFEQAGYLYRRNRDQKVSLPSLAAEAGMGATRVERIIDAYQLMTDQRDMKRDHWSYYDEFVKSRKIAQACEAQPAFRERVLGMIKAGGFTRAQDFRDKLPVICDGPSKVRSKFANGKLDFDAAFEAARDAGGDNMPYQRLHKFRQWLADSDTQDALDRIESPVSEKVEFELKKIQTILAAILKKS